MKKLTLILTLTLFLTNCMTIKALDKIIKMKLTTPSRVLCTSKGEVIYDGTPSGVAADRSYTYIIDDKTGLMLKTRAICTYDYN